MILSRSIRKRIKLSRKRLSKGWKKQLRMPEKESMSLLRKTGYKRKSRMLKMRGRERRIRLKWPRNKKEERLKLLSKKEKQIWRLRSKRRNQESWKRNYLRNSKRLRKLRRKEFRNWSKPKKKNKGLKIRGRNKDYNLS